MATKKVTFWVTNGYQIEMEESEIPAFETALANNEVDGNEAFNISYDNPTHYEGQVCDVQD